MIEFTCRKVDKKNNNTPILKDTEIDEFAEILVQDYKSQLLKEPRAINYLHFLESYLGANVEFHDIYYGSNERPILGATVFNNEGLKVFDKENMCTKVIKVKRRTIIIDNGVMEEGKEGLALFTGLHEGGHLWIHPSVYTKMVGQISLFDEENKINPVVCCRKENIENFGKKKSIETAEDWREHHADYFASAIAMPKSTFVPLVKEILKGEGIDDGRVVTGVNLKADLFAEKELPRKISEVYGVSKLAASIKLKKFGFVIDQKSLKEQNAQMSFL